MTPLSQCNFPPFYKHFKENCEQKIIITIPNWNFERHSFNGNLKTSRIVRLTSLPIYLTNTGVIWITVSQWWSSKCWQLAKVINGMRYLKNACFYWCRIRYTITNVLRYVLGFAGIELSKSLGIRLLDSFHLGFQIVTKWQTRLKSRIRTIF